MSDLPGYLRTVEDAIQLYIYIQGGPVEEEWMRRYEKHWNPHGLSSWSSHLGEPEAAAVIALALAMRERQVSA